MTALPEPRHDLQKNRGTLFVEDAEVLRVSRFPAEQFIVRLHAPRTAERAEPGSFVHLQCDESIPMRRPLSIMRANRHDGWIEVLFKIVGDGLRSLGAKQVGDRLSTIGPIGQGFRPDPDRPDALLIGGGVGIPPMVFLAESMHAEGSPWRPLVLMGSEIPFPFEVRSSTLPTPWLDEAIDGCMPLLDDWQIPSRLASLSGFDATFDGYVTDLARRWLESRSRKELRGVSIFACGPTVMLQATARLAAEFGLPCQVSLEEYMACAVGGCAGCTVLVETGTGPAMQRVCVDGPVFEAASVFPADTE